MLCDHFFFCFNFVEAVPVVVQAIRALKSVNIRAGRSGCEVLGRTLKEAHSAFKRVWSSHCILLFVQVTAISASTVSCFIEKS